MSIIKFLRCRESSIRGVKYFTTDSDPEAVESEQQLASLWFQSASSEYTYMSDMYESFLRSAEEYIPEEEPDEWDLSDEWAYLDEDLKLAASEDGGKEY